MKKSTFYIFSVFTALIVIVGCSSSKHAGERSAVGRAYQNTTARYNGYYYARLKITDAETQMIASRKYDYDKLLPVFSTGNTEDAVVGSDMDSVIRRLTIVTKLHPDSKWTDDSYFNIGKAYFYKKNYEAALATFQYVSANFNGNKTKASSSSSSSSKPATTASKSNNHGKAQSAAQKQKEAENAEAKADAKSPAAVPSSSSSGFLKHMPVHNEDLLWMARTYTSLERYSDAQSVLSFMKNVSLPADLSELYALTQANLFIQQKQYSNAIAPMKSVITITKNKKDKTRYTYILAQLCERSNNYKLASQYYDAVTKMRADYDMVFNARMAVAKTYVASGAGSPGAIIAELESMSRDEKYEDFYDQIYYELALVDLRQNKEDIGVKNLETSIRKSTINTNQKGLSFLKLGEIDFKEQDYLSASPGYDSAVSFLDPKFDTIDRVKAIQSTLKNLSNQYQIITQQDSLQKLASMSEKDRDRFIDDMIAQSEREKQLEEKDSVLNEEAYRNQQLPGITPGQNQASGSTWYFYNTSLKSTGFNEFKQKWGNRPNGDNWRRSNKSSSDINASAPQNPGSDQQKTASGKSASDNLHASLLANIPLTPEKMEASNKTIFDAYYVLGTIYKDDLHDIPKATETFEKMAARFSGDKNIAQVYYSLYLIYQEMGNKAKAETYKQLLVNNFPTSSFASVLSDPDYLKKTMEKENALNTYYASTYNYYVTEKYPDVIARAHAADTLFKNNPLQPKFDLLEAFSIGKTQDRPAFIAVLDTFVKRYPTGDEHEIAVELLIKLGVIPDVPQPAANAPDNGNKKNDTKNSPYQFHANEPQYLVITFNTISPKTRAVLDSIDNFNSLNHSLDNYKTSSQLLDTKSQMIIVKQMKNSKDAITYYNEISDEDGIFEPVDEISYEIFIIDAKNYPIFYQRKNVDEYRKFFEANYDLDDSGE